MVFSLPGNNPIAELRRVFARCLAYSRTYNKRNLEHYWYPSWNHTLFDLIYDNPRLLVAPQFPIYISSRLRVDGPEEKADVDVDEHLVQSADEEERRDDEQWIDGAAALIPLTPLSPAPQPRFFLAPGPVADEADTDDLLADASFSTAATSAESKPLTRVTDFAILHIKPQQNPALPTRYEGYRVDKLTVPLLLEEKRFPSRSLTGAEFDEALWQKIAEAQQDSIFQVVLLLRRFPEMTEVMCIAASGPWWTNTTFRRARNNTMSDEEFEEAIDDKDYRALYAAVAFCRWSIPLRLDTPASTRRFKAIRNKLAALQ
ncbi:hypothetical protein FPV67DRAFT_1497337 [Lyophyllum atratum]|nr:hypothetical protein FPV67DRAFT_1497337 [Lyophyllum atratum]